ncbi:MAG: type II toxin-antitoxin system Phd/YefM family antitoxin [Terriglobales bacterium]
MKTASTRISRSSSPAKAVTATDAKNEFGRVLEQVLRGDVMFITRHGNTKAVLMPVEQYTTLTRASAAQLDDLHREFDLMLEDMQTPTARAAMERAFHASPKQLGRAAVGAARRSR